MKLPVRFIASAVSAFFVATLAAGFNTSVSANSTDYPASEDIAGMLSIGRTTACYIVNGGTVKCWGRNLEGQAGNGTTTNVTRGNEVAVSGITNAVAVSTGTYHACALLATGEVKCWGSQQYGTLGNGVDHSSNRALSPVSVTGITNAVQLSTTWYGGCVITTARELKCWGSNANGEVGDGTTTMRTTPVTISLTDPVRLTSVDGITTCVIAEGASAATTDDELWCWGWNLNGALTGGSGANGLSPQRITTDGTTPLTGVVAVSNNGGSVCAVVTSGNVWCWGSNVAARLGNGTRDDGIYDYPGRVMIDASTPLTGAVSISAVQSSTCVITIVSGTKAQRCWGVMGQSTNYAAVIPSVTASDVAYIAAAESSSGTNGIGTYWCAIMTNNKLVCGNDTGSTVSPTLSAARLITPAPWVVVPTTTTTPTTTAPTTTTSAKKTTTTAAASNSGSKNPISTSTLPRTGTGPRPVLVLAFLVLTAGAVIVATRRRLLS